MKDITSNSIDEHFQGYVHRMVDIRRLSSPELEGLNTADAYSAVLLDNFKHIGSLAQENRDLIAEVIDPLVQSDEPLSEDLIESIRKLNENLIDAIGTEYIDLPVATILSERLARDAEEKADDSYRIRQYDKQLENCYMLYHIAEHIPVAPELSGRFRQEGLRAAEALLAFLDKEKFAALGEESREIVMINARYAAVMYEVEHHAPAEMARERMKLLERALDLMDDPFYRELLPDFDWRYHLFRIYEYLAQTDAARLTAEEKHRMALYAAKRLRLWNTDPEYFGELRALDELERDCLRTEYVAGLVDKIVYQERLYENFRTRDPYNYEISGLSRNLELIESYLETIGDGDLTELEMARLEEMYQAALAYVLRMPKMGLLSTVLGVYDYILESFVEIPGGMTFEEMGIRSLAALHPPTYIHSNMVALLSRCLAKHLLRLHPEQFAAFPSARADEILHYTYHAALCHDFGKLAMIDTIFVYGRKLLDFEFETIRYHPAMGAHYLEQHLSTRAYADVARGHHLWYDGSKGYPQDFAASRSPYKTVIDLVACADCMDAATDSVGRSYNRGKTFEEFEREVADGAGARYAPYLPELLADPDVRYDIRFLLSEGRSRLYRETYLLLRNVNESTR